MIARCSSLSVVVDGNNLEHIVVQHLINQRVDMGCSYECIKDFVYDLLVWLKKSGVHITCFFFDLLSENEKLRDSHKRKRQIYFASVLRGRVSGTYNAFRPRFPCRGFPYPRVCKSAVRDGVLQFLNGDMRQIRFGCTDPDRW